MNIKPRDEAERIIELMRQEIRNLPKDYRGLVSAHIHTAIIKKLNSKSTP